MLIKEIIQYEKEKKEFEKYKQYLINNFKEDGGPDQ